MKINVDIIRTDIIMLNGTKDGMRTLAVFILVLGTLVGIFLDPMGVYLCMLTAASMFVPMLFQTQGRNNCERMYSLLPISRKQLVASRFAFVAAVYLAVTVVMLAIMKISFAVGTYKNEGFYAEMLQGMGEDITYSQICSAGFWALFAVGALIVGASLRSWFNDSNKDTAAGSSGIRLRNIIKLFVIIMPFFIFEVILMEIIPPGTIRKILMAVVSGDGVLFTLFAVAFAACSLFYSWIRTVKEYERKEL